MPRLGSWQFFWGVMVTCFVVSRSAFGVLGREPEAGAYYTLRHDARRMTHCILHIAYCILHIAYCVLRIAYCVLRIAYCVLRIAYCCACAERACRRERTR